MKARTRMPLYQRVALNHIRKAVPRDARDEVAEVLAKINPNPIAALLWLVLDYRRSEIEQLQAEKERA